MVPGDRSFSVILQDIIRNFQEIVRSEFRLAKIEIREELDKAKHSTLILSAGAVTALFATLFLLLTILFGLALVIPIWAAALIVGVTLAVVATVLLKAGVRHFRQIHPTLEHTVETIKENIVWAKQQGK